MPIAEQIVARAKASDRGGSSDIDADVMEALGYQVIRHQAVRNGSTRGGVAWRYRGCGLLGKRAHWCALPRVSRSIDEALRIVERVLGEGALSIELTHETAAPGVYPAAVLRWYPAGVARDGRSWHAAIEGAPTIPLALIAALFEALPRLNPAEAAIAGLVEK
jgi:hypothetical protein